MHVPDRGPVADAGLLPDWPLILLPVHIVFLELIIDPACSVVFEAEPEEADVMITSASSGSASNTTEHAGSMMSSRNTMCIGKSTSGHLNNTGMRDSPAIGTCTAKM